MLIEAGADVDSRCSEGEYRTPLFLVAHGGHVGAVKEVLRAKANPLLAWTKESGGRSSCSPAGHCGGTGALGGGQEMILQLGVEGCGGASSGMDALSCAAANDHVGVLRFLTHAGVVDTGEALKRAAGHGGEASVKFLRQEQQEQQEQEAGKSTGGGAYVNTTDPAGLTPLAMCIFLLRPWGPRVVRLLVNAGADTTSSPVHIINRSSRDFKANDSPLALANFMFDNITAEGSAATEQHVNTLKAIRRLLLQVEAVHAVSWLWQSDAPSIPDAAADGAKRITAPLTPLTLMMPTLRRRAARRSVLLSALYR